MAGENSLSVIISHVAFSPLGHHEQALFFLFFLLRPASASFNQ